MASFLDNDIKALPGVGDHRRELLGRDLNIHTLRDLLYYFPFRYIDRSMIHRIGDIRDDSPAYIQLRARVTSKIVLGSGPKQRLAAEIADNTGTAELVWFRGIAWQEKNLEVDREYIVFGKPTLFNGQLSIVHPEMEPVARALQRPSAGSYQGVYYTSEKLAAARLDSKGIYNLICALWKMAAGAIVETLPPELIRSQNLMPLEEALRTIHFPKNDEELRRAQFRLKFEELLGIQLHILSQKHHRMTHNEGFVLGRVGEFFNDFYRNKLPFPLTEAQMRVVKEIRGDVVSGRQMNRLLQGDVGSGKTVVALMAMLMAADNGFQACMMAPTEILARQHYATLLKMLDGTGCRVEIITGSSKAKERRPVLEGLADGSVHILVGTHALIEDTVMFHNLGLVVIDEQHRFGVEQRSRLWTKGRKPPHILVMSATPIPRTLAMTLYGDLDVSVIDKLPPGRKPIKTVHLRDAQRLQLHGFMRKQIESGRQIYMVYPLITESEKMDYKDLSDGFESITQVFPEPDFHSVVVHGKLKAVVKQENMDFFKSGAAHIMVATQVIEVGVDVPNATVMVIESAERFGLSQLHQLRGRVGRGGEQSYCVLMSGDKLSREAQMRLDAMVRTNDGFELSELDLKLRGSGDLAGTMQSGIAFDLKIADLGRDVQIIELARRVGEEILARDPELAQSPLLKELRRRYATATQRDYSMIS